MQLNFVERGPSELFKLDQKARKQLKAEEKKELFMKLWETKIRPAIENGQELSVQAVKILLANQRYQAAKVEPGLTYRVVNLGKSKCIFAIKQNVVRYYFHIWQTNRSDHGFWVPLTADERKRLDQHLENLPTVAKELLFEHITSQDEQESSQADVQAPAPQKPKSDRS